jgi:chromosome segregation ATPase
MDAQLTDMVLRIETRTRQMLMLHQQLRQEIAQMRHQLDEAEAQIRRLQDNNKKLQEDYAHLKISKYVDMADDDTKQIRSRISKMVRDIDKCIAMLKTE